MDISGSFCRVVSGTKCDEFESGTVWAYANHIHVSYLFADAKIMAEKIFLQFLFLQRIKMGVEASKSGGVFAFFLLQISTMKKIERMAEDPILRGGFFFLKAKNASRKKGDAPKRKMVQAPFFGFIKKKDLLS